MDAFKAFLLMIGSVFVKWAPAFLGLYASVYLARHGLAPESFPARAWALGIPIAVGIGGTFYLTYLFEKKEWY
jgi:hypothetical protein